jgi:hypothetical protein
VQTVTLSIAASFLFPSIFGMADDGGRQHECRFLLLACPDYLNVPTLLVYYYVFLSQHSF